MSATSTSLTTTTKDNVVEAKAKLDAARKAVVLSEQEMQKLKRKIRELGDGGDDKDPNSLEWVLTKIEGLSDDVKVVFKLQLSSPIEEGTISKVFIDSKEEEKKGEEVEPTAEDDEKKEKEKEEEEGSSSVKFSGVETSNAILTITLKDAAAATDDIILGTSESIDIASLSSNADLTQPQYVTEMPVVFVLDAENDGVVVVDKENDGVVVVDKENDGVVVVDKENDAVVVVDKENDAVVVVDKENDDDSAATTEKEAGPVCTATFQVTFKPSAKDQREELYDLLNKASEKKNKAIVELNEAAKSVTRANPSSSQAAVQKGFLNKSGTSSSMTKFSKNKKNNWMKKVWNTYLGPQSFARKTFPVVKNYLIFLGVVSLFHFKGQELALPPPV